MSTQQKEVEAVVTTVTKKISFLEVLFTVIILALVAYFIYLGHKLWSKEKEAVCDSQAACTNPGEICFKGRCRSCASSTVDDGLQCPPDYACVSGFCVPYINPIESR